MFKANEVAGIAARDVERVQAGTARVKDDRLALFGGRNVQWSARGDMLAAQIDRRNFIRLGSFAGFKIRHPGILAPAAP